MITNHKSICFSLVLLHNIFGNYPFAGEQMDKSRRSDPEFYQMDHKLRYSVQNYSAAKLLCDTMMLDSVQADVFQIPFQHG